LYENTNLVIDADIVVNFDMIRILWGGIFLIENDDIEKYSFDDILESAEANFNLILDEISSCVYVKDFESIMMLPENFIVEGLTYNEMYNKLLGYYSYQLSMLEVNYGKEKGFLTFIRSLSKIFTKYVKLITDRMLRVGFVLPVYIH